MLLFRGCNTEASPACPLDKESVCLTIWPGIMEKEQFDQLMKISKELNGDVKEINSRLEGMDKCLREVKKETKGKRRSLFDI